MPSPQELRSSHPSRTTPSQQLPGRGSTALLSAEEEITLARAVQSGRWLMEIAEDMTLRSGGQAPSDAAWALEAGLQIRQLQRQLHLAERAKGRMVTANLRLVASLARKQAHRPLDLDDLIQEGTLGLIRAVQRFDPTRGYRFSTYATWWIREGMGRALTEQSRCIRLPAHMHERLHRLRSTQHQLAQQLGREPSLQDLATATGLKALDIREVLFRAQEPLSLESHSGQHDAFNLMDTLPCQARPPQELITADLLRQDILEILEELPGNEAELLRLRYGIAAGEPLSLSATARQMGITRDTARGLERRAVAAIKNLSQRFVDYLET
jgi:RNA polymerase nonessential primary-like sigma factor|uniref:sigma-70 family RNA polymerase sigma factor n=1 Tax=Cyanobium sp. TaxID=2164130 RepID=UPI00404A0A9A